VVDQEQPGCEHLKISCADLSVSAYTHPGGILRARLWQRHYRQMPRPYNVEEAYKRWLQDIWKLRLPINQQCFMHFKGTLRRRLSHMFFCARLKVHIFGIILQRK